MKNTLLFFGALGLAGWIAWKKFLSPEALKKTGVAAARSVLGGVEQEAAGALDRLTGGIYGRAIKSAGKTGDVYGEVAGASAAAVKALSSLFGSNGVASGSRVTSPTGYTDKANYTKSGAVLSFKDDMPQATTTDAAGTTRTASGAVLSFAEDPPRYTDDAGAIADDANNWLDQDADAQYDVEPVSPYAGEDQQANFEDQVSRPEDYSTMAASEIYDATDLEEQYVPAIQLEDYASMDPGYDTGADPATIPAWAPAEAVESEFSDEGWGW